MVRRRARALLSRSQRTRAGQPRLVAIKRINVKAQGEGLRMEAIREIKLLQELNHPNVLKARWRHCAFKRGGARLTRVQMFDVFHNKSNINIVLVRCAFASMPRAPPHAAPRARPRRSSWSATWTRSFRRRKSSGASARLRVAHGS
jgi:serine/threonine protein kinase